MRAHAKRALEWRRRVYELLEHGPIGDFRVRLTNRLLILLIVVNLVVVALETVPRLEAAFRVEFIAIEIFSLIVFTVEYFLRVWVAVEHAPAPPVGDTRALGIHQESGRPDRPHLGAAVLARLLHARRVPRDPRLPHRALSQARALLSGVTLPS
ncbi:MAG: hypothetical protein ACXW3N_07455 [Rhodoplanes sp.]